MQSVESEVLANSDELKLSCRFLRGSRAQGCILTVCEQRNGETTQESCTNITIERDPNSHISTKKVMDFRRRSGVYAVNEVAEIESDGSVTVLRHGADVQDTPWLTTMSYTTLTSNQTAMLYFLQSTPQLTTMSYTTPTSNQTAMLQIFSSQLILCYCECPRNLKLLYCQYMVCR